MRSLLFLDRSTNLWRLGVGLLVLVGACRAPEQRTESPFAPAPDPNAGPPVEIEAAKARWTKKFNLPQVLVAREVRIDGPPGLLEHVVARADPGVHLVSQKATPNGFLQVFSVKDGLVGAEIRALLDQLSISALARIEILERPGPCDVRVLAVGEVFWSTTDGRDTQRGDRMEIIGPLDP